MASYIEKFIENPGLEHLAQNILKEIDIKSLTACRLVSKTVQNYIDSDIAFYEVQVKQALARIEERVQLYVKENQHEIGLFLRRREYIYVHLKKLNVQDKKLLIEFLRMRAVALSIPYRNTGFHLSMDILQYACYNNHSEIVKILLKVVSPYDISSYISYTADSSPLDFVCRRGNVNCLEVILEHGSKIYGLEKGLRTACYFGQVNIVKLLLEYAKNHNNLDLNRTSISMGRSPFYIACQSGNVDIVEVFLHHFQEDRSLNLNLRDHAQNTPLHEVCKLGKTEVLELMLKYHKHHRIFDFIARNHARLTMLHLACMKGHVKIVTLLLDYLKENDEDFDINAVDHYGQTAFHYAVYFGNNVKVVQLLLKYQTITQRLNLKVLTNPGFMNILHMACYHGRKKIAQALLGHSLKYPEDIDINSFSSKNATPMHLACHGGQNSIVKLLLKFNCDLIVKTDGGYTPLHLACRSGRTKVVSTILKYAKKNDHVIDMNIQAKVNGNTPLQDACLNGHHGTAKVLLKNQIIKIDINLKNLDGDNLLHIAISGGNFEIVKELIDAFLPSINLDAQNKNGQTPLMLAWENDRPDIVTYLFNAKLVINKMVTFSICSSIHDSHLYDY